MSASLTYLSGDDRRSCAKQSIRLNTDERHSRPLEGFANSLAPEFATRFLP